MLTTSNHRKRTARRAPRIRETPEIAACAARMIRATGTRAALDIESMPLLADLSRTVEAELARSVTIAREQHGYSWTDIGQRLGITKQAAQQRFGSKA